MASDAGLARIPVTRQASLRMSPPLYHTCRNFPSRHQHTCTNLSCDSPTGSIHGTKLWDKIPNNFLCMYILWPFFTMDEERGNRDLNYDCSGPLSAATRDCSIHQQQHPPLATNSTSKSLLFCILLFIFSVFFCCCCHQSGVQAAAQSPDSTQPATVAIPLKLLLNLTSDSSTQYLSQNISLRYSTVCASGLNIHHQIPLQGFQDDSIVSSLQCHNFDTIFTDVSTSMYNTFMIDVWGKLWVAGLNSYGQMGLGFRSDGMNVPHEGIRMLTEQELPLQQGDQTLKVHQLCAMDQSTIISLSNGDFLSAGRNHYGQLGQGSGRRPDGSEKEYSSFEKLYMDRYLDIDNENDSFEETAISSASSREAILTSSQLHCGQHSVYVLLQKSIISWGRNDMFQLGDGTQWNRYTPQLMPFFSEASLNVEKLAIGQHEAYALDSDNELWAWGRGYSGQIGWKSELGWIDYNQVLPARVSHQFGDGTSTIVDISAGDGFVVVLTSDGSIASYGSNLYGQLANGELGGNFFSLQPVNTSSLVDYEVSHVDFLSESNVLHVQRVAAGLHNVFVVSDSGQVYGAGNGANGIFGDDSLIALTSLQRLNYSFPIERVSASNHLVTVRGELCGSYTSHNPKVCNSHGLCGYVDGHAYCACEAGYSNQLENTLGLDDGLAAGLHLRNISCAQCAAGTYAISRDEVHSITECIPCPLHTYSTTVGASDKLVCTPCPPGYITLGLGSNHSSQCHPCVEGEYAFIDETNGFAECRSCPPGTYNTEIGNIGISTCTPCPTGTWQPLDGQKDLSACLPCERGTYQPAEGQPSNSSCLPCPLGSYQPYYGQSSVSNCTPCPLGQYASHNGSVDCSICPPNFVTHTLGATSEEYCDYCNPGFYSVYDPISQMTHCEACPKGTYSNSTEAISPQVCNPCPAGYVTTVEGQYNASSCEMCPATTYAKSGDASCTLCPSGTYSTSGSSVCLSCPPGKVLKVPLEEVTDDVDTNCGLCEAGTWTLIGEGGLTECIPCVAGTFSTVVGAANDSVCTSCPTGTWNEDEGSSSLLNCTKCEAGTWSNTVGADTHSICIPCDPGYFSNRTGATSVLTCTACPSGTYQPEYAASDFFQCLNCPAGTSNPFSAMRDLNSCQTCPPQTYSSSGSSVCTPCPLGHYTDPTINGGKGKTSINDCIPCPVGTYLKITNGTGVCRSCPKGTASPFVAQYSPDTCVDCPPGSYANSEGQAECILCDAGTWSASIAAEESDTCILCPAGYFSEVKGANQSDTCQPCPSGSFQEYEGSSFCCDCPKGTYSTLLGSANSTHCIPCAKGYYGPLSGASSKLDCLACPQGSYNEFEGMFSLDNCTLCTEGSFSPVIAAKEVSTCKLCPEDSYADEKGLSSCKSCPFGEITSCENVFDSDACLSESASYTSVEDCRPCAAGYWRKPADSASGVGATCEPCPPGYWSDTVGAVSNSTCMMCPPGTYTSQVEYLRGGVPSLDLCLSCPAGTANPNEASAGVLSCQTCPAGTWSAKKSSECTPCVAGTASNIPAATSSDTCKTCPAGTWSSEQSTSCTPCTVGHYSEEAGATSLDACIACPVGTASNIVASSSSSDCVPCALGYHASEEASSHCSACDAGKFSNETGSVFCFYCPAGSFSLNASSACTPCNVGTYSSEIGAPSRASCKICPFNTYNPVEGASKCMRCSGSALCPQGASALLPDLIMLRQEDQRILSPVPELDQTTYVWLKWGTVILIAALSIVALILVFVLSFCSDYKEWFHFFRQSDILFNMVHNNRIGTANNKQKTRLGGLCSMLTLPACLIIFSIIVFDAFYFNVQTTTTFKLLETQNDLRDDTTTTTSSSNIDDIERAATSDPSYGNYKAAISLMGTFPQCRVIDKSMVGIEDGFWIEVENIQPYSTVPGSRIERTCSERTQWLGERINNCYCEIECIKCQLLGISQSISFGAREQFASTVGYMLEVPYYSRTSENSNLRESFLLNGTVVAQENHIFYGTDPVQLYISVFETQYITTPNFIFDALGRSGSVLTGLTSQLLTVSHGDSPEIDEDSQALKDDDESGFHFTFSIGRSNLSFVQQDVLLQDFIAIMANLAALISAVYAIAMLLMNQYEKRVVNYEDFREVFDKYWARLMEKYKQYKEPKIEKIPRNTFKEDQDPWDMKDMEHPIEPPSEAAVQEQEEETLSEVSANYLKAAPVIPSLTLGPGNNPPSDSADDDSEDNSINPGIPPAYDSDFFNTNGDLKDVKDPWAVLNAARQHADLDSDEDDPTLSEMSDDRLEEIVKHVSPEMLNMMRERGAMDISLEKVRRAAVEKAREKRNLATTNLVDEDASDHEADVSPRPRDVGLHSPRSFMYGSQSKMKIVEREPREFKYEVPSVASSSVTTLPPVPTSKIFEGSISGSRSGGIGSHAVSGSGFLSDSAADLSGIHVHVESDEEEEPEAYRSGSFLQRRGRFDRRDAISSDDSDDDDSTGRPTEEETTPEAGSGMFSFTTNHLFAYDDSDSDDEDRDL